MIGGASALKISELILIKRKLDRRLLSPVSHAGDSAVEDGCLAEDCRHVARVPGNVARLLHVALISLWGHGPDVIYFVHQLLS